MRLSESTVKFNFPVIETDRLSLRMFQERDLDSAFRLFNDSAVQKYLSPRNRRTREQTKFTLQTFLQRWQERGFGLWRVSEKIHDEMIGYCGFQYFDKSKEVEVLFAFFAEYWGKGLATEAANACLRFGFETLSLNKIFAAAHPENAGSCRVLEKIGLLFQEKVQHYGIDTITYLIESQKFQPSAGVYKLSYENF